MKQKWSDSLRIFHPYTELTRIRSMTSGSRVIIVIFLAEKKDVSISDLPNFRGTLTQQRCNTMPDSCA